MSEKRKLINIIFTNLSLVLLEIARVSLWTNLNALNPQFSHYNQIIETEKAKMNWNNMYMNYPIYWPYAESMVGNNAPVSNYFIMPFVPNNQEPRPLVAAQNQEIIHPRQQEVKEEYNPEEREVEEINLISPPKQIQKEQDKNKNQQAIICQCSKSKCIKEYCFCFKNGIVCGQMCNCLNCKNKKGTHHKKQREKKNKKITCNCIWSKCSKKYCQCFANGNSCGQTCKCVNCQN